jgi:GH25 family lysozyme M1 (1,4-beta-N-acetylmuramidase)
MFLRIITLILGLGAAFATTGFDISVYSGAVSTGTFQCMANNGYVFAIIEAWTGGYTLNVNYPQNWRNAKAGGLSYVDIYAFVCNQCYGNTPTAIAAAIKASLPSGFNGMLWLDIEPCSGCWSSDGNQNLQFVDSVAAACQSAGFNLGVYSSYYSWQSVMGSATASTSRLSALPLWYAHYDNDPSFDDPFYWEFGGWSQPNIKQYAGNGNACGLTIDYDWYP